MAGFVEQALLREPEGAPAWLAARNRQGRDAGRGRVLPNFKVEAWKYTSLRVLEEGGFVAAPQAAASDEGLADHYRIDGLDAHRLVFVNGVYRPGLSAVALPEGVTLVPFSQASEAEAARIAGHLGTLADGGALFTALNDSWLADGVFLRVSRDVRVEQPIQLVWLSAPEAAPFGVAQRLLVVLEEGSEASVLEHFATTGGDQNGFTNGVTELLVGDNARLHHCRLHLEESGALHLGAVHASLGRNATLNGFHMALGSPLKRIDLVVRHRGEGAHCELNGVYLPRNREVIDYHTCIEHEVPHCTSEETFRGIIADEARAVFNGRIHIHPGAQKTSAHLSNRNLLTSNRAEVDTKPELEIYADDVQCSHGATVAQLDEGQLHYLRTRGVSEQEARVLLSFGFINEILNRIHREPLRDYLRPKLAGLFARDPELARHLL
ncbi:MAG: Fe-S cluster assembly protein SufD [Porticoccaceae bacterium]|jgi:Fe-S cluster assembly protein SufD|nr:Fe-S cluster assembly protein SufD [Porticoccaceae bacterium]HLS97820.1 Fe-S cluster assembly protein SufD [Porticoccaceae bacterium]